MLPVPGSLDLSYALELRQEIMQSDDICFGFGFVCGFVYLVLFVFFVCWLAFLFVLKGNLFQ